MEDKVIFEFESNGEIIVMDGRIFGVADYDGLESSDYKLSTEENVNNVGERIRRKQIMSREIMVEFDYLLWKERSEMRQKLIRFFQIYRPGTLTVNFLGVTRRIDYEVSSFKIKSKNIHEKITALLYMKCMDPAFQSAVHYGEKILVLIGGWNWKFTLPFRMKQFGELKKNIHVGGDLETPVEIYFRGPADNPMIKNHRTGEYLKLNRNLTSDDTLYINTEYRKKTVEIIREGEREDAWDYLDFSSKFFWLYPGDNLIEYSGSDDSKKSKGAEIYYRERYLGV